MSRDQSFLGILYSLNPKAYANVYLPDVDDFGFLSFLITSDLTFEGTENEISFSLSFDSPEKKKESFESSSFSTSRIDCSKKFLLASGLSLRGLRGNFSPPVGPSPGDDNLRFLVCTGVQRYPVYWDPVLHDPVILETVSYSSTFTLSCAWLSKSLLKTLISGFFFLK